MMTVEDKKKVMRTEVLDDVAIPGRSMLPRMPGKTSACQRPAIHGLKIKDPTHGIHYVSLNR